MKHPPIVYIPYSLFFIPTPRLFYASKKPGTSALSMHAFDFCVLSIHFQYPNVTAVKGTASAKKIHSSDEATVNPPPKSVPKNCIPNSVYVSQPFWKMLLLNEKAYSNERSWKI